MASALEKYQAHIASVSALIDELRAQRKELESTLRATEARAADRKRWSKDYARTLLGRAPKDDNEADGVCLAVFGAMNFAPRRTT